MGLSKTQQEFAVDIARLILYISTYDRGRYAVTLGEAYRPEILCQVYSGNYMLKGILKGVPDIDLPRRGIVKSRHNDRLAVDLNLFIDGIYVKMTEDYKVFGDYWKKLHPDNRWGGDFSRPDGNHFERAIQY